MMKSSILLRLALEKPYEIRFIEQMPFGDPIRDHRGQYLSGDRIQAVIEKTFLP
jgi:molybdenum cofactor biosynthesis enzyme MoaA